MLAKILKLLFVVLMIAGIGKQIQFLWNRLVINRKKL